jgi:hypothetical protein
MVCVCVCVWCVVCAAARLLLLLPPFPPLFPSPSLCHSLSSPSINIHSPPPPSPPPWRRRRLLSLAPPSSPQNNAPTYSHRSCQRLSRRLHSAQLLPLGKRPKEQALKSTSSCPPPPLCSRPWHHYPCPPRPLAPPSCCFWQWSRQVCRSLLRLATLADLRPVSCSIHAGRPTHTRTCMHIPLLASAPAIASRAACTCAWACACAHVFICMCACLRECARKCMLVRGCVCARPCGVAQAH